MGYDPEQPGLVLGEQGKHTGGEAGTRLLAEAVQAYREALTVQTKEQLPQDWAATQNNLGRVLCDQGTRTSGESGTRLLAESIAGLSRGVDDRYEKALPSTVGGAQSNSG